MSKVKIALWIMILSALSGCRFQTQWPFETFFQNNSVHFPEWTRKKTKKANFFQKILATDGDHVTFAIGLPDRKSGVIMEVNCSDSSYHVLETLSHTHLNNFRIDDPFYQLNVFGIGIRYVRLSYAKSITANTMPFGVGSNLCSEEKNKIL